MSGRRLLALTIWAFLGFCVLIGLGTWQIQRLHWKEGLIAQRDAALSAPPVPLPRNAAAAAELDFHRVEAEGQFLHEHEFYLNATERRSGRGGFLVLTPLRLEDGAIVLVERGWVPPEQRDPATRGAGNASGIVSVEGLLRMPSGDRGWFVPANDPTHNQWFYVDLPAMARADSLSGLLPFYIEAGPAPNPGGLPLGGQAETELVNNHLQYAITWFSLAGILVVFYLLVLRRERADRPRSS
ncbi:MAG TPA: SURF1 family protein [Stellaceae bacterium]|nr:SURF1 family protein [Stellaceae bacterium]